MTGYALMFVKLTDKGVEGGRGRRGELNSTQSQGLQKVTCLPPIPPHCKGDQGEDDHQVLLRSMSSGDCFSYLTHCVPNI